MTQGSVLASLDEETVRSYTDIRELPDGRVIGVLRLLLHWTIHVDISPIGYEDRYCYATYDLAKMAFEIWDGTGDPVLWHRHVNSGRRRNLQTGEEWIQW